MKIRLNWWLLGPFFRKVLHFKRNPITDIDRSGPCLSNGVFYYFFIFLFLALLFFFISLFSHSNAPVFSQKPYQYFHRDVYFTHAKNHFLVTYFSMEIFNIGKKVTLLLKQNLVATCLSPSSFYIKCDKNTKTCSLLT